MSLTEPKGRATSASANKRSATAELWQWALLLPLLTFVSESMCVWPAPRFLGGLAEMLVFVSAFTVFGILAAVPASVGFAIRGLVYWKRDGEFVRNTSRSLACVVFVVLWLVAWSSAASIRHRAFVRASLIGDHIVQALADYRRIHGQYPDTLDRIVPEHLDRIPYTGMIGYQVWRYTKDRNDLDAKPDSYELRIDCPSGGLNFDRFIYWPSERYPRRIQGNGVEEIRSWAYVHE